MTTPKDPDYESLHPNFGWLPIDVIQLTCQHTTQYAQMPMSSVLQKHYHSPYPALNVHHRNEPIATDTVFSNTLAIDGSQTMVQIFVGTESLITDIKGMKSETSLLTLLKTTFVNVVLRLSSSVIAHRLRSAIR
jgi:hypothetical protein